MAGLIAALTASAIWGFAPVYFSALKHVALDQVLAHRIAWACILVLGYCAVTGRLPRVWATLRDRRLLPWLLLTAAFMSFNYTAFLVAVAQGRVFEIGLGYYMMPLISVALGVVLLRERLSGLQWAAVGLAGIAVTVLGLGLGVAPWMSLALGTSFACYGFLRKRIDIGSIVGFQVEILAVTPFALAWLAGVYLNSWEGLGGGTVQFGDDAWTTLLLVGSGVVTGLPLILFAEATRRMEYSTVGLLQYLNPSLQVLAAGAVLGEHFTRWHWIALGLIWVALTIYGRELLRQGRARRRASVNSSTESQTVR